MITITLFLAVIGVSALVVMASCMYFMTKGVWRIIRMMMRWMGI